MIKNALKIGNLINLRIVLWCCQAVAQLLYHTWSSELGDNKCYYWSLLVKSAWDFNGNNEVIRVTASVLCTALSTWSSWCPCWECCPRVERSDSVLLPPPLLSPVWVEGLWHPGMALLGNKLLLLLLDPINVLQGVTLLAGLCINAGLITIIITLPPLIAYLLNKTSIFLLAHPSPPPQNLEGQNPLQVSLK